MARQITSREFNQDASGAKRAAQDGPVYITHRGRPAHVLLTYEAYERLVGARSFLDLLGTPAGVEDVELTTPRFEELADVPQLD